VLRAAMAEAGLALLGLGADPVRAPVRVHPGSRYVAMAAYFRARGFRRDGAAMMCSTAALQVNVDAGPAAGWADRVAGIHVLGPALVALSAASPLLAGVETGWRSSRQRVWGRLDPGRCAPFPGRGDPAGAWASFALAAPVMFIRDLRTGSCRAVGEWVPLIDWVGGVRPLAGRRPTTADVDLHLTTLWPPLRLRGWLELRVLDTVPDRYWPGLAAVAATVLDDPVAFDEAVAAAEPIAGRWEDAARLGVRDPALAQAARGLVTAALDAVPSVLRGPVEAWAELVDAGRTPTDAVLERSRRDGVTACLSAEELS
jgi:ergothioneine biosynthesis glutamate--cysteine ligase EgtA